MTPSAADASQATDPKPVAPAPSAVAKPVRKPAVKPAQARPAAKASPARKPGKADIPAAKPAAKTKAADPKPAKVKPVRDSFTMPSDEYAALAVLKQRALAAAHPVKKSELLRAGIKLLAGLSDAALLRALKNVPAIKTGRPKSKKGD